MEIRGLLYPIVIERVILVAFPRSFANLWRGVFVPFAAEIQLNVDNKT